MADPGDRLGDEAVRALRIGQVPGNGVHHRPLAGPFRQGRHQAADVVDLAVHRAVVVGVVVQHHRGAGVDEATGDGVPDAPAPARSGDEGGTTGERERRHPGRVVTARPGLPSTSRRPTPAD